MATNSNLGTFGVNSGFDSTAIIQKMVELNRRPISIIEAKQQIEQQKLSSLQDLKSRLQTFKSTLTTMNMESRFIATKGTFVNSDSTATNTVADIVTNSLTTPGTYSFNVTQLAKETKVVSEGFASINSTIPRGILRIKVGEDTREILIDSSNNTVAGLRLAINNSGANVRASYLDDGSSTKPIRLSVTGTETGTANAVTISVFQPQIAGEVPSVTFTQTQAAQNAQITVDGIQVSKSSNTLTDVISNAVISLFSTGNGTIKISNDTNKIKDKVKAFVNGYNDMMGFLNEQLKVDVKNQTTGTLFGNSAVENLQSTMRNAVSGEVDGIIGNSTYLSQIGIKTQSDGTLSLDESVLNTAIANDVSNVSQLFSSKGSTTNNNVTYIGFTEKTVAGTYNVRVVNGIPQLSLQGTSTYTNATGNGNFWEGATGKSEEGLNFRLASNVADGDYGTLTLAIGVAETLNRAVANLTDLSRKGPLASELDTVQKTIEDNNDTINEKNRRLDDFESNLRERFSNLEVLIGKLQSQQQAFNNALNGLQQTAAKK